ncbi:MAG: phosphatase PAP2 family protein [Bacteroidales bacterium]
MIPLLIVWLSLIPVFLSFNKIEIHLYLNRFNSDFADVFFRYVTALGSGLVVVIVGVFYLFISFRRSFILISSGLLAGLLVQVQKRLIFPGMLRPFMYLKGTAGFHIVENIDLHANYSFPSGHSATAFALCFSFAAFSGRPWLKFMLLVLSGLIAFSRIYLSQHFLIDVYFGSMTGVLSAGIMYHYICRIRTGWIDGSVYGMLKRDKGK